MVVNGDHTPTHPAQIVASVDHHHCRTTAEDEERRPQLIEGANAVAKLRPAHRIVLWQDAEGQQPYRRDWEHCEQEYEAPAHDGNEDAAQRRAC